MVYTFELFKHANIRYRDAVERLARCELLTMLRSLSVFCDVTVEQAGTNRFLTFECRELSDCELEYLSGHSSVALMAEKKGPWLRPLPVASGLYLPEDLPEVLKYKGKTGVPFTRMMINTAYALASARHRQNPPVFFDPVCGKATGCFCALMAGMNAVGLDTDQKALKEAADYIERYLKYHKLKHEIRKRSETFGKTSVPVSEAFFADTKDHYLSGNVRHLTLACADTAASAALFRRRRADLIAADLPYGVQHASLSGRKPESLPRFLHRVLPVWKSVLRPGGTIALSFNTLTLPSAHVREALEQAGFILPCEDWYDSLRHEVEQAVIRDVIFALNPEEECSDDTK